MCFACLVCRVILFVCMHVCTPWILLPSVPIAGDDDRPGSPSHSRGHFASCATLIVSRAWQ